MIGRAFSAACAVAFLLATPAHAAWTRVETDRFVVYGQSPASEVRAAAERLLVFDALLRIYSPGVPDTPPAKKLEIYFVQAADGLKRVNPRIGQGAGGFYRAAPRGSYVALLSRVNLDRDDALFHEYAHHFMLQYFPAAYPAWFIEGFAEYFMTAEVHGDDVKVGVYNEGRVQQLQNSNWLRLEDLLGKRLNEIPESSRGAYYAQAWLLTHYMRSSPERRDQMNRAITAIARGEDPVKAFRDATGQAPDDLTMALQRYRRLTTTTYSDVLGAAKPSLTVTTLGLSADAFLLDSLRLIGADTRYADPKLLEDLRTRATRFPDDLLAQSTVAQAEYAWGDAAAAAAIMKRLVSNNPTNPEVYVQAGLGELLAAYRDEQRAQPRRVAARAYFAKAFQLDQQDYRSLFGYAVSRTSAADFPTENDIRSLLLAYELAPQVDEVAVLTGTALIQRGRKEDAALVLAKPANNPHGGAMAERARALLEGKGAS